MTNVKLKEVAAKTNIAVSSIRSWISAGLLPKPALIKNNLCWKTPVANQVLLINTYWPYLTKTGLKKLLEGELDTILKNNKKLAQQCKTPTKAMSLPQWAKHLKITTSTLRHWINIGLIPTFKHNKLLFHLTDKQYQRLIMLRESKIFLRTKGMRLYVSGKLFTLKIQKRRRVTGLAKPRITVEHILDINRDRILLDGKLFYGKSGLESAVYIIPEKDIPGLLKIKDLLKADSYSTYTTDRELVFTNSKSKLRITITKWRKK